MRTKKRMSLDWIGLWLVSSLLLIGCVRPETRRAHARNIAKAEVFKREFDANVPSGAPLATVEAYVRSKGFELVGELDREGTGDKLLELIREDSINWYCGKGSVGLIVYFAQSRMDRAWVESWSFDCP
jgi:hypothetical protein